MSNYKALVLRMRSDFAHWRNPFSLSILETFLMPQKTSVLGILGAMCGLIERDVEKLGERLKVSIKLEKLRGIVLDLVTLYNLKEKGLKTPIVRQLLFKVSYTFIILGPTNLMNDLLFKIEDGEGFPIYAGVSEMLAEARVDCEIEDVKIQKGRGEFFNVSLPYFSRPYEWKVGNPNELIVPPRVVKKTLLFRNGRKEKEFIDILEGYNIKIKPSWEIEYVVYNDELFPVF
jgi:CRISPR-associated Cas5-like protein